MMIARNALTAVGGALLLVLSVAGSASAQTEVPGGNLIVNGDAETGDTSGWTTTGGFEARSLPGRGGNGEYVFWGGTVAVSTALQMVSVSQWADEIDAGGVVASLSALLGGWSSQRDHAVVDARFLDDSGDELDRMQIGPVTNLDRQNVTTMLPRAAGQEVPPGTRSIEVLMTATRFAGVNNDGTFDDVTLTLSGIDDVTTARKFGQVTQTGGVPVANAEVSLCATEGGLCLQASADANGDYAVLGIPPGEYRVVIRAGLSGPADAIPHVVTETFAAGQTLQQDVQLRSPGPMPEDVALTSRRIGTDGIPVVYWRTPLALNVGDRCTGGTAVYEVHQAGVMLRAGPMAESPAGTYTAVIEPLHPAHGFAEVSIVIDCPEASADHIDFSVYIDPSGVVIETLGRPVNAATVVLLRSDSEDGPFQIVPDGSLIMSPSNRTNPDLTDAEGRFGWDVIAGFYKVTAAKEGCEGTESHVMDIPPEVTDLELVLQCDTEPPETTATVSPEANEHDWNNTGVTVTLVADDGDGVGVEAITWSLNGGPETVVEGTQATVVIDVEGEHELTFSSRDRAGNIEAPRSLEIKVDTTSPEVIYHGNQGVYTADQEINIICEATDNLSGVADDSCEDVMGPAYTFALGENSFVSEATDVAGNVGSGSVTFSVEATYASLCGLTHRFVTNEGVARSLCMQLQAAGDMEQRGRVQAQAGSLGAYVNHVRAQADKSLTIEQANILIGLAEAL